MRYWIVAGLVLLNLMLAAGVYSHFERSALAQIGAAKGDYAVVAGANNGQAIVYIMESGTGNLIAVRTDPVNHVIQLIAKKPVAQDLASIP